MSPLKSQSSSVILIEKEDEEILFSNGAVKIKNTDFWVTPGIYSETNQYTNQSLINLAEEYNLEISTPELRGVFIFTAWR